MSNTPRWGLLPSILFFSALGCVAESGGEPGDSWVAESGGGLGYSGVSQLEGESYVVVFDTKRDEDEARVGILTLEEGKKPAVFSFPAVDWEDPRSKASDLESICALATTEGEFLVLESGSWRDYPGRIFRIKVTPTSALVLGADDIPSAAQVEADQRRDQYEGMACATSGEGKALVILGERGGSADFPRGVLRWGLFDLGTNEFQWLPGGEEGVVVTAPGVWPSPEDRRDITGLFLDQENTLWASAVVDGGDWGPFHSVVYAVASVDANEEFPLLLIQDPVVGWEVPGHKIEGLAAPPGWSADGLILATFEDELMGGDVLILQKTRLGHQGGE